MNPEKSKIKQEQSADVIDMRDWLWDNWDTTDLEVGHVERIFQHYDDYRKHPMQQDGTIKEEMAHAARLLEGGMPPPPQSVEHDREYDELKGEEL